MSETPTDPPVTVCPGCGDPMVMEPVYSEMSPTPVDYTPTRCRNGCRLDESGQPIPDH